VSLPHRFNQLNSKSVSFKRASADQKLGLDRMTVRGFPTQRATDLLNKTSADLQLLRQHPQILRGE
jgi:hypothetical protein